MKVRYRHRAFAVLLVLWIGFSSMAAARACFGTTRQESNERALELKDFDKFLQDHPAILPDLKRDPSLITKPEYLEQHPDLKTFLATHPHLEASFIEALAERHCDKSAPEIFDKVSPAVVFIYATSINPYQMANRVEHVMGSGFIFDSSGLILTNSHVAFGRQSIEVTLDDGTSVPAQLVGADPIFDLAVLRIEKPSQGNLFAAPLGDSNRLRVGEEALAIGNPLGLEQTLTHGSVSAINRVLPPTFFAFQEPLIQVDTPINPGNSGGPLLNSCGEVVGITTAVVPDAQNIGFAIPINLAKAAIPALMSQGRIVRPWLGFHGQFIDNTLRQLLRIPLARGFLVEVVEPGSPAQQAKLQGGELELNISGRDFLIGGDIITKINGTRLTSADKVIEALKAVQVGSNVSLTVFRQGKYVNVAYTLPERPLLPGDLPAEGAAALITGNRQRRSLPAIMPAKPRR
jgi:S1-C subfamily serine protease